MTNLPETFDVRYIKATDFKTVIVDGAFSGVNAFGKLNLSFFIDTVPVPSLVVQKVQDNGALGDEVRREVTNGSVRELPVAISMDMNVARSLRDLIDQQIKLFESNQVLATEAVKSSKKK